MSDNANGIVAFARNQRIGQINHIQRDISISILFRDGVAIHKQSTSDYH